jgi:hypothetical protein
MKKRIDAALPNDNRLAVRLDFGAESIVIAAGKIGLHGATVAEARIEVAGGGVGGTRRNQ